ncbi:MAG: hypothetical protein PF569_04765 [Candidatus Woesearchaeota archaeon]|jgi:predicted transcriptional regulator|nr:hypothetical protein [Candidatus Woesearchaeota archaeon]
MALSKPRKLKLKKAIALRKATRLKKEAAEKTSRAPNRLKRLFQTNT